jgi:hypothetical protein
MPFVLSQPWAICLGISYHDRDAYFMEATPIFLQLRLGVSHGLVLFFSLGFLTFKTGIILLRLHKSFLCVRLLYLF